MFEVPVTQNWFKNEDTVTFVQWTQTNNIADGDWDFKITALFTSPIFLFRYEEDATAFKLKFNL